MWLIFFQNEFICNFPCCSFILPLHTQLLTWPKAAKEAFYIFWFSRAEFPDVQAGFRKGRGTRDQVANLCWIVEKEREFQKTSTSASLTKPNPLTVWMTTRCGKLLEIGISDHLTCFVRNLYVGQETTVRNLHGTTDWFKIEKGVRQSCILSCCLFNLYAEYIIRNVGWMNPMLESRLLGEISTTSEMQMIPL